MTILNYDIKESKTSGFSCGRQGLFDDAGFDFDEPEIMCDKCGRCDTQYCDRCDGNEWYISIDEYEQLEFMCDMMCGKVEEDE